MAIGDKLKVTRDQLAEFIESHNTIRQFERLFEYINTFVIPGQPVIPDNIVTGERYDTGWVANSDWTIMEAVITHGLDTNITDLIVELYTSVDETEANTRLQQNGFSDIDTDKGFQFRGIDTNSFYLNSGIGGAFYMTNTGSLTTLNTQSYYYKVVVTKLTIN